MTAKQISSKIMPLLFLSLLSNKALEINLFTKRHTIFSSIFSRAESSGPVKSLPGLLKTGAALALTCLALAKAPQSAQAQSTKVPVLKLGVPLLGPAPKSDLPMPYVCYKEGTTASAIAASQKKRIDNGFADFTLPSPFRILGGGRWTRTATNGSGLVQGQPTTIRYSIVPDRTPLPGSQFGDAASPSNLEERLNQLYGNRQTWLALFAQVGAALSAQSGLTYIYEPNDDGAAFGPNANGDQSPGIIGVRGDVRISGHKVDGRGKTGPVIAYNYSPSGGGDMVIDTDDETFEDRTQNDLNFRNTITHEFGHGLGLAHTCPINETKLMEPIVSQNFDGPQLDDIRGLQRFYGDVLEDNETGATGTNLGALTDGTLNVAPGKFISVDEGTTATGVGDEDFYSFSILPNKSLSINVSATGDPYLEGPQNPDTSCTAGTQLDPKLINDLGFELLKDDGSGNFVSVGITNSSTLGNPEILPATNFPTGGNFRVRVFGGPVKDIQTYSMRLVVGPPVVEPTPVPTATVGPTPTPGPTAAPTATPLPQPTPIRPIVDLNGVNPDGSTGQDSPVANGIDNTSNYFFRARLGMSGGPQFITPPETLVLSDISGTNIPEQDKGKAIAEARVDLTPNNGNGSIAPDNVGVPNRDQEVLGIPAGVLKSLNDGGANLTVNYNNGTQVLTIKGGQPGALDFNRQNYEIALKNVTYENKRVNPQLFDGFEFDQNGNRILEDRVLTYVVDTDNEDSTENQNQDNRFGPMEGPGSNQKQSKVAVLTLRFAEQPSLVVTTTSDESTNPNRQTFNDEQTSLREAMTFANQNGGAVTFAPGVVGTIDLLSPLPTIVRTVSITGPGASQLTVNGSSSGSSVFQIAPTGRATLSGLTITGGNAGSTQPNGGGVAINRGLLTMDACMVSGNSAALGGGIANLGGNLTLTNSTISGNTGGGLYLNNSNGGPPGSATISNSTVSGNTGNGIALVSGNVTTTYSTITKNTNAGIAASGAGRATVYNSIVSGNVSNSDVVGASANFTSSGYNIIGGGTGVAAFSNNDRTGITGSTAGLSALGDNGGETMTHALFATSPARDTGAPAPVSPPATDQRGAGFARIINNRIDVGAFERQNNLPVVNPVITPRNPTTNQTITVNANSDAPNLVYTFFVDGIQRQTGPANTFDLSRPGFGNRGQTVSVTVTATNATGTSTGTDSVVVANTAPTPSVTITATNPAPNASSVEVLTNSVLTANPTSTDVDGDTVTYTYQWSVNGRVIIQESGKTIDLARPGNGDRDDVVSVVATAFDGSDTATSPSASVTVGNTAPVAQNVTFNVKPGETVRVLLTATDVDAVDTRFTFAKTSNPTKGTATIEVNGDGRGVLVYTANANTNGPDTLNFTVTDKTTFQPAPNQTVVKSLAKTSVNATATANIQGVGPTPTPSPSPTPRPTPTPGPTPMPDPNRPPAGADTSVNAQREVPVVKVLTLSDPDPEDTYATLNVVRVSGPRKGTGEIRKDADGIWKLFYKASGLFKGNDEVRFVVIDRKGAKSRDAVITINLFNTKPTARSTKMQVAAGGSASVGIFGQDIDRDTVTFRRVGGPSKGTGEIRKDENGNFRFYYQNSPVAIGNDQVQFVALDGQPGGVSEVATIDITVVGIFNRAPSAQNVSGTTTSGTPVAVAVSGIDPDEGDVLTFKRVGGPSNGTGEISLDADGTYKMFYTPRPGFIGTETIRYVALDQKNRPSAPANITITVTASAPSAIKSGPAPSAGSS